MANPLIYSIYGVIHAVNFAGNFMLINCLNCKKELETVDLKRIITYCGANSQEYGLICPFCGKIAYEDYEEF